MRSSPLKRRLYRPPRRAESDKVTPEMALAVFNRDGGCVAVTLGEPSADCWGRLTIEHVKSDARIARRAEPDLDHLVALCLGHTEPGMKAGRVWNLSHKAELRDYLGRVNG